MAPLVTEEPPTTRPRGTWTIRGEAPARARYPQSWVSLMIRCEWLSSAGHSPGR